MKAIKIVFIGILQSVFCMAQNYQITFSGTGDANIVDSVKVDNITQSTHVSLGGNDILELTKVVLDLKDKTNKEDVLKIFPNPVNGKSKIYFVTDENAETTIDLCDITGRRIAFWKQKLSAGNHEFSISGIGSGIYVINVNSKKNYYSGKIISINDNTGETKIIFFTDETVSETNEGVDNFFALKQNVISNKIIQMQYNQGDVLIVKGESGKYSTITVLKPTEIFDVIFTFVDCTDFDGNNYSAVKIGNQTWMAQNLKTTSYKNGDPIGTTLYDISQENMPKYQWAYEGNEDIAKVYGRLYTWHVVNDLRGLAPTGWHIPSDVEWSTLVNFLDGEFEAGGELKEVGFNHWITPNTGGSDVSGFTALPGGYRSTNGRGYDLTKVGYFWSATSVSNDMAYLRSLTTYGSYVTKSFFGKKIGFSVRCIKD